MMDPIEMLLEFVKKEEPDDYFEIGFYAGVHSWRYTPYTIDSMVEFLFEKSLTHYIDDFIPYGNISANNDRCSSLVLFLKPCNKNHMYTNITSEVVDALKNFLYKAKKERVNNGNCCC